MPNMMPKVGHGVQDCVFYNIGHGHLGWTLSAVTAELVAEKLMTSRAVNASGAETAVTSVPLKAQGAL